jgi:hypothetical protein
MKKNLLLLVLLSFTGTSFIFAQNVSTYTFAQPSGTYTAVTGTSLFSAGVDDASSSAVTFGFTFNYHGVPYTQFTAQSNGYIVLGSSISQSYSALTTNANCIAFANRDGSTGSGGALWTVTGTSPNRVLTIQYTGYYLYYGSSLDNVNAQIKLYETTNVIEIIYGASSRSSSYTPQVGITGAAVTDYSTRTGATWSASTTGGSNAATMTWSTTSYPASGQIYRWTPPSSGCTNTSLFPSAFAAPSAGAGAYTIATNQYQSEYNQMTGVTAGHTFSSTGSIAGTYITVRSGTYDGTLVAAGTTPLAWTATAGGTYFIHYNTNSSCGIAIINMITTITNTSPVPLPGENCANAQNLASLSSPYSATTASYADDISVCQTGYPDRIFYIDVPNGYSVNIWQSINAYDSYHYMGYGGTCPGTTTLYCIDDSDTQQNPWTNTTGSAQTVWFIVDGYSGSGTFTLNWTLTAPPTCGAILTETNGTITTTTAAVSWTAGIPAPSDYEIEYGVSPYTFTGTPNVTTTSGAASYTFMGLSPSTTYQFKIRSDCGGGTFGNWSSTYSFTTATAPPANDNVCSATALAVTGSSPYNFSFGPYSNANSTTEVGEPVPPGTGCTTQTGWCDFANTISNTIWFALTVPTCGLYSIETDIFDTQIALYSAASCSVILSGGATLLAANDDESSSPYDSKIVNVPLQSGVTYYLQLDSYTSGSTGSTPIKVTGVASAIPAITSASAVSPYVCPGATTTLNANGVGGEGAIVTWWTGMNGTGTNLGTGTSLPGMGTGTYYARVTGNCSPAIEASVTVTGLDPAMATVPASDGTTRTADKECSDGTWTDYYQGNNILLSIKKNGQAIGTVGDGNFFVRQKGSSGFSPISNLWPANYCNTTNWKVMNRYWDVTTVTQPTAGVNVRFYYTTADYDAVKNALEVATPPRTITSHSQLLFYKINDLIPSGYNIDPTGGHTNIPLATGYGADGYYEYLHGGTPGTAAWTYSAFGAAHYGEYTVSKFSGGGGGGGNSGGAFPIELLYFTGHAETTANIIEWATATEKNNQYQIVERSANGIDSWTEIGRKAGAGNSTTPIAYKLTDTNPLSLGYYRLRAVDFDGTEQLSEVISLQRESDVFAIVNAFPVPVEKEVTLMVNAPLSGDVDVVVTDNSGKRLYKSNTTLTKGVNEVKIDMENLLSGTYMITLDNGSARVMKQIVK